MNNLDQIPILKKGGIHIKKKNRGKFTAAAKRAGMGVQEFARHILANKDKYSSTLVKRANFARNSKKFKHENGGILKYQNPATTLDLPEGSVYGGELEPAVVKPAPLYGVLNTYYPVMSKFPLTGHSELQIVDFGWDKPLTISKYGTDYDYNLVTNNCSDATRCAVEKIFGEKINPVLFTTPGDVQDFVAEKTGQKPVKEDVGQTALGFNIPFATAMDLKNQNLDFYIQDYLHKAAKMKKQMKEENPNWNSASFDLSTAEVIQRYKDQKYKFQPFKNKNGGILKAQEGTGNLYAPHPLSPVGIALNQAKTMAKMKGDQQYLPPGVKEVVGPDGKKVAIRTEQPLQPMGQEVAAWLPGVGDVVEVGQIANDVKNGNLGTAALAAGLMVLPGNARKILDKFGVDLGDISTFKRLSDQEWDDMYFQAIDSGDMDLVQAIRDAHFKVKAPNTKAVDADGNPIRLFHGEKDSPTYHDLRYLNSGPSREGLGVYYSSSSKDIAKTYAQHKGGPAGQVREVYYNVKNPNVIDAEGRSFQTVLIEEGAYGSKTGVSTDQLVNRTYWDKAPEGYRKKSDKDGLIIQNVEDHAPGWTGSSEAAIADNYVTWNPYAVKSTDAIVRHPQTGEIIPISKRDNFNVPSILMGTTPLILGLGAAKTVSNSNTKEQQ